MELSVATPFDSPFSLSLIKPSVSTLSFSISRKYLRALQVEEPSPILNLLVSVSNPISPAASTGFPVVHCVAVPHYTPPPSRTKLRFPMAVISFLTNEVVAI